MVGASAPSNGVLPTNEIQQQTLEIIERGSDARLAWVDVVVQGAQRTVTPELAAQLLKHYPSLALHTCKSTRRTAAAKPRKEITTQVTGSDTSDTSDTFGDHLVGALLPHALEHLTIELLVQAYPGEVFAGATRWLERSAGTMRVRVSLPTEGGASRIFEAFSEALRQLNRLIALSERYERQKPV